MSTSRSCSPSRAASALILARTTQSRSVSISALKLRSNGAPRSRQVLCCSVCDGVRSAWAALPASVAADWTLK
ncbi:PH-signaling protein PalC [Histoplasma ohiense]|uniref:PH-signaling protein PalC n=1 Tax=Ajellomyces capsulatus TaxID=5037 RepID=A0A8H7YCA2_AJECA|nr:PH-signaling protein PalC [Histoplasma capsulatum]KAG5296581.1 PH-signaling protein PalC [Histoplasma ohiense (nom. inval.)]QSS70886.1 PH-signaling protein PalC [Histoplasma capsulatum G186AR]